MHSLCVELSYANNNSLVTSVVGEILPRSHTKVATMHYADAFQTSREEVKVKREDIVMTIIVSLPSVAAFDLHRACWKVEYLSDFTSSVMVAPDSV